MHSKPTAMMSSLADTHMSRGRTLLLALTLAAAIGCGSLGVWQLRRLFDRRERNRLAMAQRDLPIVDLNGSRLTGQVAYRRATVRGQYDFDRELVIRGRLYRGTPGVHIMTPLKPEGIDTAILVNRGFVPTPDAGTPPSPLPYREPPDAVVDGVAIGIPDQGDGQPLSTDRGITWHRLDLSAIRKLLPYPVAPYYLIAEVDSTKTVEHTIKGHVIPVRIEPPPLDDGPHLSYAVQWFLIGGAALGFGIVFVRRRTEALDVPD